MPRTDLPSNEEHWTRLQEFANRLQGYANVLAGTEEVATQADNLLKEAAKLDLGHASLLPGWRILRNVRLLTSAHAPPVEEITYSVSAPFHKRPDVPWAQSPGRFCKNRDAVLQYLTNVWLPDYNQRLQALQLEVQEKAGVEAE